MRTHMHHLTAATVAALIAWSGPALAQPPSEYEATDYLPLAVGNSWTFRHSVSDDYGGIFDGTESWPGREQAIADSGWAKGSLVTITVERTEEIEGLTFYVLSGMPEGWPPPPPHCPVGKKLRWKGSDLMERTDTGEQSFFRFESDGYTIPLAHGDDEVKRWGMAGPPPRPPSRTFRFSGNSAFDWLSEFETEGWRADRSVSFLAGYGLVNCSESAWGDNDQGTVFINTLEGVRAVLVEGGGGGASGQSGTTRTIHVDDAVRGGPPPGFSSSSSSSWGQVKGSVSDR